MNSICFFRVNAPTRASLPRKSRSSRPAKRGWALPRSLSLRSFQYLFRTAMSAASFGSVGRPLPGRRCLHAKGWSNRPEMGRAARAGARFINPITTCAAPPQWRIVPRHWSLSVAQAHRGSSGLDGYRVFWKSASNKRFERSPERPCRGHPTECSEAISGGTPP
jgi:hypothetical protein